MNENNSSLFLTHQSRCPDLSNGHHWVGDLGNKALCFLCLCHFQSVAPKVTVLIWITLAKRERMWRLMRGSFFCQPVLDVAHSISLPILLANTWWDCHIWRQRGVTGKGSLDVCLEQRRNRLIKSQSVSALCFLSETSAQPDFSLLWAPISLRISATKFKI